MLELRLELTAQAVGKAGQRLPCLPLTAGVLMDLGGLLVVLSDIFFWLQQRPAQDVQCFHSFGLVRRPGQGVLCYEFASLLAELFLLVEPYLQFIGQALRSLVLPSIHPPEP